MLELFVLWVVFWVDACFSCVHFSHVTLSCMVSDKFDVTLILFPFVWSVSFISTPTLMLSLFSSSFLEQFEYDVSWGVVLCIL